MKKKLGVLILTPFFSPNIGGVETHLSDLVSELARQKYSTYVLTYSPITTITKWKSFEKKPNLTIYRFRWFGKNLFHVLEKFPLFDFIYLTPYLLIRSVIWMFFNHSKIHTIHTHGFNAAFIGNILAAIFHKKHITSTHAVYDHINGFSQRLVIATLNHSHHILCLSESSKKQLLSWRVNPQKISVYRYWIDLHRFSPSSHQPSKLTFLFVGRLIKKKGIKLYLQLTQKFPQYDFLVVGTGPEQKLVNKYLSICPNLKYLGTYPDYQQASVLITPSLYAEGYGRVVMEATASGLPVIASNLGGLPEALDKSVAILVKPTLKNLSRSIEKIAQKNIYQLLQANCRRYAENKFSAKNINQIIQYY